MVVRVALSAIPHIGGPLVTAWAEWDTNRRFCRVQQTLDELARALADRKACFRADHVGEPEMQILEAVLAKVQVEHRVAKRRRFAMLVVSDWTRGDDRPFEERMNFIRALDEMEETHIRVLAYLRQQADSNGPPSFAEIGNAAAIPDDERDQRLLPALNTLASDYGFIRRAWGISSGEGHILSTKNLSPEGIARKCEHTITTIGRRFLDSVSLPGE
jgi:hypothetical protein